MLLGDVSLFQFLTIAETVFKRFLLLADNPKPERQGCYISLMKKSEDRFLTMTQLGEFSEASFARDCCGFSREKANRLKACDGHFSSWQSRDYDAQKYGGAITAPPDSLALSIGKNLITSISGLPEHGDEAVGLVTDLWFKWLVIPDIEQIIAISGNKLFYPLFEACGDLFR